MVSMSYAPAGGADAPAGEDPAGTRAARRGVPGTPPPRAEAVPGVGQIAGLRPRADVELLDALDRHTRRTVAAWLLERPSTATRQACLQTLAGFLRWLQATEPHVGLLAATGAHLDAYCEQARIGALTVGVRNPGRALSGATVARKHRALSSFYWFAWSIGAIRQGDGGSAPAGEPQPLAITRDERRLLRLGASRLAADGRVAEAVAVALIEATGASVATLAGLTSEDLHAVGHGSNNPLVLVTMRDDRGDVVTFPVPTWVHPWLKALSSTRAAGDLLIKQGDGQPVSAGWLTAALRDAGSAGGIPASRAKLLHPRKLRAGTATAPA
ncbi:hypothetical protein [Nonomuraea jabiensis]|uniref:Site-specific recombinase XerD n=1 Tax=Nonomuraea jabiensis TaxID=882448 RepID=A0A7W9GCN2_9ACTN|nr:hypothetical protein [Nonomuraea jabiensis]MBB5781191.1 site-specific recombinase XerD [Nonomuraea jabiensis]